MGDSTVAVGNREEVKGEVDVAALLVVEQGMEAVVESPRAAVVHAEEESAQLPPV